MNRLVSYSETSSDDEDKFMHPNTLDSFPVDSKHGPLRSSNSEITDPITDESDVEQTASTGLMDTNGCMDTYFDSVSVLKGSHSESSSSQDPHLKNTQIHKDSSLVRFSETVESDDVLKPPEPETTNEKKRVVKNGEQGLGQENQKSELLENPQKGLCNDSSEQNILTSVIQVNGTGSASTSLATGSYQSDHEENRHTDPVPRSAPRNGQTKNNNSLQQSRKRKLSGSRDGDGALSIPDSIQYMYSCRKRQWVDNPQEHGNRIRSFPHMEGNWATYVFIPVKQTDRLMKFVEDLLRFLRPGAFHVHPEFHVSLSRTVAIRHHWIEPLVDSLRENLRCMKSCISDLTSVKLFTNDEKTRTFVCLELSDDDTEFQEYVTAIDKSFAEFKLPPYYENPSFHISVGWCLGDMTSVISEENLSKARKMLGDFVAANPELSVLYAQQVCCQSGNKSFVFTLEDS